MPSIKRRTFLGWLAASSALPLVGVPACGSSSSIFPHGIASGDPMPDGVVLWTRVAAASDEVVTVDYEVASDAEFQTIVTQGSQDVDASTDHTLHVVLSTLAPATRYWYRFVARGETSPVGRTKTAPLPDADVPLRIAVASCQDFGGRWFHAWRTLAERDDIDLVLFIGDYIYETIGHLDAELPAERTPEIPDGLTLEDPLKGKLAALTLADYRALYQQYRSDPDLQAVHAQFPFVMLWDDHEFANDCWREHATDFDDAQGDELEPDRRAAATRAWHEYSPVRVPYLGDNGFPNDISIFRALRWGRHAELVLLDERYYRDDHLIPEGPIDREVGHIQMNSALGSRTFVIKDPFDAREAAASPPPSMLGIAQRDWAIGVLQTSAATWKLLVSPLVMAQMALDLTGYAQLPDTFRNRYYFKTDQWDGYRTERRTILEACAAVDNLVVLSGDLHGFYAAELYTDFDAPSAPTAVEYATSAISAATVDVQLDAVINGSLVLKGLGLGELVPELDANLLATNPHMKYAESTRNGLAIVEIGAQSVDVQFLLVGDVTSAKPGAIETIAFTTPLGSKRVLPA